MTPSDFIIKTLKEWAKKFPDIKVRYKYEDDTQYHIVTVEPKNIYDSDIYTEAENKFCDLFMENFPDEDLLVSEPKYSLDMSNVLYCNDEGSTIYKESIKIGQKENPCNVTITSNDFSNPMDIVFFMDNNKYSLAA